MVVAIVVLAACPKKDESSSQKGSAEVKAVEPPAPATCPPGNVVKDGACIAVITPEKIAAVGQQQSKIDELAKLLDQVDTVGAPIELLDGFRQLDQWKQLKAKSAKLEVVDNVVATLNNAVKTLRAFKGSLGEASARLGNLKAELDRQMKDTGAAKKLEEVRAQVSTQVRTALEPLATQVQDTIQNALTPLSQQLSDTGDLILGACAMAKLSGGGDKMNDMCKQAKDVFAKALVYLDQLKAQPAKLFNEVTSQLETQLDQLIDTETKKVIDAAQVKVNAALDLPSAGSGSGSAAGSGSGSAH